MLTLESNRAKALIHHWLYFLARRPDPAKDEKIRR